MNPTLVFFSLMYLLTGCFMFPVPFSSVNRFDMEHVYSFRHGHNAGAPAQMRLMKPSITNARYRKSSADVEGPEFLSMVQKAPANTPDEDHTLTKRDIASAQHREIRKNTFGHKKMSQNGRRSLGMSEITVDLSSASNQANLKLILSMNSMKHGMAKETSALNQEKGSVFKTSVYPDEVPENPIPGFIEAPTT